MRKNLLLFAFLAMSLAVNAAQLEVTEYLGYMWKSITEVNFGEVAVNSSTRYMKNNQPLKLNSDVSFGNVRFTASDPSISATINPDKTIYLNIKPAEKGEYSQTITVSADGFEDLIITAKATAVSYSYATIKDLKDNATKDGTRYYYEGRAIVSAIEGNILWVSDETGGIQLTLAQSHNFAPGDVVTFSGNAMSASYAWKSLISCEVEKVKTFNWQEPIAKKATTALTDADFGTYVRLPKVHLTRDDVKDGGSVKFHDFYFQDDNSNEYHVRSYATEDTYAEYPFEENVDYDLTGCVWSYSKDSMTPPTPTINLTVVRNTVPPVTLSVGDWRCDAESDAWDGKKAQKIQVIADKNDPYRYLFKNFVADTANGASEVYGTVSPDGKAIVFMAGQQLDNKSDDTADKYFSGYESSAAVSGQPFEKGHAISIPLQINGGAQAFTLDCHLANILHNLDVQKEWANTGAYLAGSVYSNKGIASVEVQEYLGYMYKGITEVNFGNVATCEETTYYKNNKPLKIVPDGVELSNVTITCSDDVINAKIEGEELYLSVKPVKDGAYNGYVVFKSADEELLNLGVTANGVKMSFETIAELKENAKDETARYFYTGNAVVSHVENNMIWANDATGGLELTCTEPQSFVPGDVIKFSGVVMSPNYEWKSFISVEPELVEYFNWQEPVAKVVETALTANEYGSLIRLPKVHFVKQVSTESHGVTYNDFYFEDADANEYHIRSYASAGEFANYEFDKNVDYDLTGCVWHYSKESITQPHPVVNLTLVRNTVPPVSLTTGTWYCNAEFIIWQGTRTDFELEVIADENDPYRYKFKNFVYDFNGGNCTVYGTITPDGEYIEFYTGQQLDALSDSQIDKYFTAYESFATWNDNPTMPPYAKGRKLRAEFYDEYGAQEFIMEYCFGCIQHNLYAIAESPTVEWGTTGAYIEGASYKNQKPANIDAITGDDKNATPIYIDITGRKINEPTRGNIYIEKRGTSVRKIVY